MKPRSIRRKPLRPLSRASWARQAESNALVLDPGLLEQAQANTRQVESDLPFMFRLADEIAKTRTAELTLAYRSLVSVMVGFKNSRKPLQEGIERQACVILVVRRKARMEPDALQLLPSWLVTFAEREGKRMPFAVPTDVQDAGDYHRAMAHTNSCMWCERPGFATMRGSFACLVELSQAGSSQLCLLSAMHVISPDSAVDAQSIDEGLTQMPVDSDGNVVDGSALASGLPLGGRLVPDSIREPPSFDVQLAASVDDAALKAICPLRGLNPARPFARSQEDVLALFSEGGTFFLLIPGNNPAGQKRERIPLTLSAMPCDMAFPYDLSQDGVGVRTSVYHTGLLRFDATNGTTPMPGDSGSPVVFEHADGSHSLVSMHIGGDSQGASWSIPAWQIFDFTMWSARPPGGSSLEIVDPDD